MNQKRLINQLELAYAPLTAFEFAKIKDDILIEKALEQASLYIIAQRPVITFENVFCSIEPNLINFEIHQKGNMNILKCVLPLNQSVFGSTNEDLIAVSLNYLDKSKKQYSQPFNNIHGFSLLKFQNRKKEFLIWFSPEKLLQNWWKGHIQCNINGDFKSFIKYKVLYVGKATKQSILKRLSSHSRFQDILSLETPVTEKQLPANEIIILPFEFQDNIQIQIFDTDNDDDSNEIVSALLGKNIPKQEKIFLDAEKALIKALKPNYNKEMFNNYPFSKDGLYNENFDSIAYTFVDPITLTYNNGEICGKLSQFGGDTILISNNSTLELYKEI